MTDSRLEPIYRALDAHNLDAAAIVPGSNFKRLFAIDFHLMERPLVILIPRNSDPVAIVPRLEMGSFDSLDFQGPVFSWPDEEGYDAAFASAADCLPELQAAQNFGLEAQRMRVFEQMALQKVFPNAIFRDSHAEISEIRLIKTSSEIDNLKKAIQISEAALEATLQQVEVGQTEKQIEAILLKELFANGADGLAFDPIVAAGENSAQPHASARHDYQIKEGDALMFDFGASWNGYNADITRTFFIKQVSEHDRAFYETVLSANERGKLVSRAGTSAHEVDDQVQKVLENSQFAQFRRHKTGHGLGLDVHEAPQIMRGNRTPLQTGMVFTVEPGLYRQGECGVRIEDDVVVTDTGIECLTSFPRDLRLVG
ncbi:MAG: M24 family metallopeptidase [Rhizobiaceae bacterium]|nr:M24 family metallopeptidase [Rhizobiaceae bacterium]